LAHIEKIMAEGTGADRQLRAWEKSGGDLKAVVDQIIDETYNGLNLFSGA
jgi:carboxylate-amine ligase